MMNPEGPCVACEAWRGAGCAFLRRGDTKSLLDRGGCQILKAVESWVGHYVRVRCPGAQHLEEDILQDVQLMLHGPDFSFPPNLVPNAAHLRRWLRTLVLNRITDYLRRERVIPKIRCGACLYFTPRKTCELAGMRNDSGEETANPHYGTKLDPHTNPAALVPPCRSFFWRYRRTSLEGVSPRARAPSANLERQETSELLDTALLRLLRAGPAGRRQAFVLSEHFTHERPATAIATELGVSERTVRRDIAAGLKSLHQLLTEKFGFREEDIP